MGIKYYRYKKKMFIEKNYYKDKEGIEHSIATVSSSGIDGRKFVLSTAWGGRSHMTLLDEIDKQLIESIKPLTYTQEKLMKSMFKDNSNIIKELTKLRKW